jgi:hypothetical protein
MTRVVHPTGIRVGADGGGSPPARSRRPRPEWRRRTTIVLLAALALVPAVANGSAAAQTRQLSPYRLLVGGLTGSAKLSIVYTDGQGLTGQAEVYTGTLQSLAFNPNGFQLRAFGNHQLSGRFTQEIQVNGASLTGVATIPDGTFVRLRNLVTNGTVILKGGPFSIPTGAGLRSNPKGSYVLTKFGAANSHTSGDTTVRGRFENGGKHAA